MEQRAEKKRLFDLDFIRVFSMMCILIYHFLTEVILYTEDYHCMNFLAVGFGGINIAHVGISLFFILSGAAQMISPGAARPADYYKRRIRAIYPAYYIVWAGLFAATLLLFPWRLQGIAPWTIIFTVLGMDGYLYQWIPNFYMTGEWFLGCVILLYACCPLLRKGMEKAPRAFLAAVIGLWLFLAAFRPIYPVPLPLDHIFYFRIPEFLAGMYLMRFWKEPKWYHGAAGLLAAVFFWAAKPMVQFELVRYAGIGLGCFIFLRTAGTWLGTALSEGWKKAVYRAASVSYEIFLLHHAMIVFLVRTFLGGRHLAAPAAAALFAGWLAAAAVCAVILRRITRRLTCRRGGCESF